MNQKKLDKKSIEQRRDILEIVRASKRGHIGSAFSVLEIMRVLFEHKLKFDPKNPHWEDRDRFILSKCHGSLALYYFLAKFGYFPKEELQNFCNDGAMLGGLPEYGRIPGVEISSGALGHGLSIGVGTAIAARLNKKTYHTFVLIGDGESQEGSVWEAALAAHKHKLSHLTVLVDNNGFQSFGPTKEVCDMEPMIDKWRAFGFEAVEVDGHDPKMLLECFQKLPLNKEKPTAVICKTVKGKGIREIENNDIWHYKSHLKDEVIQVLFDQLEKNSAVDTSDLDLEAPYEESMF